MRFINSIVNKLRADFLGDVLKLSISALGGRLLAFAALPLLTRMYTPEDFALLAVYLALINTLAVAACLRLEIAIPIAKTDTEAAELLALALMSVAAVTVLLLLPALLMPETVANWMAAPEMASHIWLVPLGVAFAGSYSALQYWATRARRFGQIARTRIGQSGMGVATMLILGWVGLIPLGLLLGNMLNIGAGGISLIASAAKHDNKQFRQIKFQNLYPTFTKNHRYPLLSTPEALLNVAGAQLPVLVIAAHSGAEAGFLLLALQVIAAPMTLLGNSISQVYISRAPDEYRTGNIALFTLSVMRTLIITGVGPLVLAGALSPTVFPMIFGTDWTRAGQIATWLIPWMVLQFIGSPVSMALYVTGKQKQTLILTAAGLCFRLGGVLIAMYFTTASLIIAFVIGSILYYIAVLVSILAALEVASCQWNSLFKAFLDIRVLIPTIIAIIFIGCSV